MYGGIGLLVLSLIGIFLSSYLGHTEAEQRSIANSLFYIGFVLGVIGFICLIIALYSKFKQRDGFGEDDI